MTQEDWKFINTFAPWFSAIATFLAVLTSLYYSASSRKIKLDISTSIFEFPENGTVIEYIFIQITNSGYRDVIIKNFSWEFGLLKKVKMMTGFKYIDKSKSIKLPCLLKSGEMAQITIPIIKDSGQNYLEEFYNDFLKESNFIYKFFNIT